MKVCIHCKQYRMVDEHNVCEKCKKGVPNALHFDRIGNAIVPIRSNGLVLSREEWGRIAREIERFYYSSSDQFIEEYNETLKKSAESSGTGPEFGFVYLLHSENGYYKIGRTQTMDNRLGSIRREYPVKIELLHLIPCDDYKRIERMFHILFADRRVQGEWFDLPESAVEKIKATTYQNVNEWLR